MKFIILSFLILFSVNISTDDLLIKIAMIDTGVNIDEVNKDKLIYSSKYNCLINYNIDDGDFCERRDLYGELHGTKVFKILSRGVPDKSVISVIYASPNKTLREVSKYIVPKSLKDIYLKKKKTEDVSRMISNAIKYSIDNNSKVINISLGDRWLWSKELESMIELSKDVLFVFSAGNESLNLSGDISSFPCSFKKENTICVGALDKGKVADYSNYGKDVDIFVQPELDDGTSFSSPIIANEAYHLITQGKTVQDTRDWLIKKYSVNYPPTVKD